MLKPLNSSTMRNIFQIKMHGLSKFVSIYKTGMEDDSDLGFNCSIFQIVYELAILSMNQLNTCTIGVLLVLCLGNQIVFEH